MRLILTDVGQLIITDAVDSNWCQLILTDGMCDAGQFILTGAILFLLTQLMLTDAVYSAN